ncbi:Gfo/Idh/MocA family oxidoreductase [Fictibacillus gelatini]|uniref:Gfo/Idh/MocA family oxidoreductase n=1 Tax=Fictibacillus gelatini TaxID=225985 RepID=UPI000418EBCC|nr:Gfo/Idh/MocA family oxidoreductase [Fictibacillus gelatini]
MAKLKIGVVGAGSISDMYLQSYEKNERAEIDAICDLNEERAKEKAQTYKATKYYAITEISGN